MHASRKNSWPVWRHIRKNRPRVFVMESAYTLEQERIRKIRNRNLAIAEARKCPIRREEYLDNVAKRASPARVESIEALIAAKGLLVHYVEGYSSKELMEFREILQRAQDFDSRVTLLRKGRIAAAMELEEKLQGFSKLGQELDEMHGLGGEDGRICVFARFGTTHAHVGKLLEERSFDVESIRDFPRCLPSSRIKIRLSENPDAKISRYECAELLFEEIGGSYQQPPSDDETEENWISEFETKFRRVGFADGFLALLREASRQKSAEGWKQFIFQKTALEGVFEKC
jgi:hypothetical protein